jgi:hypothetical protein
MRTAYRWVDSVNATATIRSIASTILSSIVPTKAYSRPTTYAASTHHARGITSRIIARYSKPLGKVASPLRINGNSVHTSLRITHTRVIIFKRTEERLIALHTVKLDHSNKPCYGLIGGKNVSISLTPHESAGIEILQEVFCVPHPTMIHIGLVANCLSTHAVLLHITSTYHLYHLCQLIFT